MGWIVMKQMKHMACWSCFTDNFRITRIITSVLVASHLWIETFSMLMSSESFLSGSFPHDQCVEELEIGAAFGFRWAHHPAVPTPEFLIATWLKRREWEGLMRVWSLFALRNFWKALETISLSCWHHKKYWKTMEFGQDAQTPETTRLSLGIFRSSIVGFLLEDFWGFFGGNFVL